MWDSLKNWLRNNWPLLLIVIFAITLILLVIRNICPAATQIVAILEFLAVAIYALYSYKLWYTTKENTDILKRQSGLLESQIDFQYRPIVAVDDIDADIQIDDRNHYFLIVNVVWLNSGNSMAKTNEYKMHILISDRYSGQMIRDLLPIEEMEVGYYKGIILPKTTQSVRIIFSIEKEEMQQIINAQFILEPIIDTHFEWQERNKKFEVKQTFALTKRDTRIGAPPGSKSGRNFDIEAKHCDMRELS